MQSSSDITSGTHGASGSLSAALKDQLASITPQPSRIWVAYSGGVDSAALLHAVAQLHLQANRCAQPFSIGICHVAHGLYHHASDQAITASQHYQCPLVIANLQVTALPGQSLEEAARKARYQAFTRWMQPGDCLLLAHHQDDQAETLLGRILRGNAASGGMPVSRPLGEGILLRPWLNCPKGYILAYAQEHQLTWSEDPSNQNTRFHRNYVRLEVMPALKAYNPHVVAHLAYSAQVMAEQSGLLAMLALSDAGGGWTTQLSLLRLRELLRARQANLLRAWVTAQGAPLPTTAAVSDFLAQCNAAEVKAGVELHWQSFAITRYQDSLHWRDVAAERVAREKGFVGGWDRTPKVLADGTMLTMERVQALAMCLNLAITPQDTLRIDYRVEGERLSWQGKERRLKSLLQDWGVLPWKRNVACLYCNDRLVAVLCPQAEVRLLGMGRSTYSIEYA
ncbi:MAG: tRNA lysidine(34) synthetase TilS [Pseudomonadota bacterium]